MGIGKSVQRQDAVEKVTGTARYVEDLLPPGVLYAKVLHSTFANGVVKAVYTEKAKAMTGVTDVVTCFDVPQRRFSTVAHPRVLKSETGEVEDRLMLDSRVRYYGDDIAVVVAVDELTAKKALELIEVDYEEYPPLLTMQEAYDSTGVPIHDDYPLHNQFAEHCYEVRNNQLVTMDGDTVRKQMEHAFSGDNVEDGTAIFSDETYSVQMVQHVHIENIACFAYMEGRRIVVVSCTQAPHVLRCVVADALSYPVGDIRIIKPYIGGAFGNKQEVLYEPLTAFLTRRLGGKPVCILLSREETFVNTRVRHPMEIRVRSKISLEPGREVFGCGITMRANKGSHASHGHAVAAHSLGSFAQIYNGDFTLAESYTIFTNLPASAAMRGYGVPQAAFAIESHMDELAAKLKLDPIELRKKYMMKPDFLDPFCPEPHLSNGLEQCIDKGAELIGWHKKRKEYTRANTGKLRRGVGMSIFTYKSCVYPFILENAGCRIILNEDGSLIVHIGATEIGQGSDTVFAQIAGETLRIPEEKIHVVSTQDTDTTPYDPGSYASRQSYVTGSAVKKAATELRGKILAHAAKMTGRPTEDITLDDQAVVDNSGKLLLTIAEVAYHALYNRQDSWHLTAEATYTSHHNAFTFGAHFADVEVDIPLGKVTIRNLVCVHDSGTIINPKLAEAQVHGGAVMGVGYALSEELLFDKTTGKPLNNNLLDYKVPTAMDAPPIQCAFIEPYEPTGPYGNKALGEPPLIGAAPAIRNALLHATGVPINKLPMTPQALVESFMEHGLVPKIDM